MIHPVLAWWQPRKLLAFAAFAFAAAIAQAGGEGRLTVDLPSSVQVGKPDVLLGDVAQVRGAVLPLQLLLHNVFLGRMPSNGRSMTVPRENLSRWVQQQTGLKDSQLEWKGADTIEVTWMKSTLSASKIMQVATDELRRWLLERSESMELQVMTGVADLVVPGNDIQLRVRPVNQTAPRERMVVWVEVFSGERFFKVLPITFKVAAWRFTSIATQSAATGEQLPLDSVNVAKVNVAALPLREATAAGQSVVLDQNMRLKRSVREGDMVTPADFEPAPAVSRGDWAVLRSVSGSVILESRVQVPHDAQVGHSIRVRPSQSSSYVWARVKAPNLLELMQ